ncbi:MAG: cobalt-precorrin-5B (C(1))-methyltransferase [Alphaproteobacteria bacterium]|nr:cobalt-precorrin-5B (C(1))-methyltransferase [Alphaproteobacteria bacterium]
MTEEVAEKAELRRGWTTGACATAAAKAAFSALLSGDFPDPVEINLPRGGTTTFALTHRNLGSDSAEAAVEKDAGDDPDVTHGALIYARVALRKPDGKGVLFFAGDGVGTVTKPGLPIDVGEAAINPVPRQMIAVELGDLAKEAGTNVDVDVKISVPGGAKIAERTMNGRLGILGGISILGTTGIVVPYSCAAWIASIHQGIDVARAEGTKHIGAATGSRSEDALKEIFGFEDGALIDMGDFAGGMLKYLRLHPVERLSLGGGFGKISKLANGHADLHSKRSSIDFGWLENLCSEAPEVAEVARTANTSIEVLIAAQSHGFPLGNKIANLARASALDMCDNAVALEVLVFDRQGNLVGRADG